MTHIKRINELASANNDFKTTIYDIENVHIIRTGTDPEDVETTDSVPNVNGVTILNCVEKYLKGKLNGHTFNPDYLSFTDLGNGELVAQYIAMCSPTVVTLWNFKEPTQKEWEDYNDGKIKLISFVYQMSIVKEVPVTREEFKKEGLFES